MYLIFHGRFPSEKAAALFAAKSAESFAHEGMKVTLLVPRRLGRFKQDPFSYYQLQEKFEIIYLPTIDLFSIPIIKYVAFRVSFIVFSISALLYMLFYSNQRSIVYSNESLPLYFISFFFKNVFYELHDFPEKKKAWYQRIFDRMAGIISHTHWKCEALVSNFAIAKEKIFYEPNAVELSMFDIAQSKAKARQVLGITSTYVVVYTGHLYTWKGVDVLAEAVAMLPPDTAVYIIGGTESDITIFNAAHAGVENLHVIGFKPHAEIALWQKAADVLVLPNSGKEAISKYYTSPMKLFEYMASRVPIVASRLPSILELIDESTAFFFTPDDAQACATMIRTVLQSPDEAQKRSSGAYLRVQEWTWKKRAKRILTFIDGTTL